MLPFEDRHSRQRRLAEVGIEGQAKLAATKILLAEHEGVQIEREYLLRAGVADASVEGRAERVEFPFSAWFEYAAPRALAAGAWCALTRIRRVLERGA